MSLDAETLKQLLDTIEKFVNNRLKPLESRVGRDMIRDARS